MTGIPASISAQLLARGAVRRTGVLAPEAAFDPAVFIAELAKRGILVEERMEEHGIIGRGEERVEGAPPMGEIDVAADGREKRP
jgi:saccharopine dehydrogenase-like NADP-dependent oxidoreductase